MWIAVTLAAATALAWLRASAQAAWPRIGFGIALLLFCAALALQLGGPGQRPQLAATAHRGVNGGSLVGLRTMVACYLAALAASGWGAWKLLPALTNTRSCRPLADTSTFFRSCRPLAGNSTFLW